MSQHLPGIRPPGRNKAFSSTRKHSGSKAITRRKGSGGQGGRPSLSQPVGGEARRSDTQGLRALEGPIRTQTDAEKTSSKPLSQGTLMGPAELPTGPAPSPAEQLQAVQAPIVHVLCASPSRPLKPQFSAVIIRELAAKASLFTPAHAEDRGFPRRPAPPCLPGLTSTLPDPRRRGWTRLGFEQFHPGRAGLVTSVMSDSLRPRGL